MCKETAESLRTHCGWKYFPEDEQDPWTAQLYRMTEEEKAIILMENFITELYLAKFGHLTSLSAFHNKKNFQAKRV